MTEQYVFHARRHVFCLSALLRSGPMKDLIFYTTGQSDFTSGLLGQIGALIPEKNIILCEDIKQLRAALLKPAYNLLAAILAVSGRQELRDLISIAKFLRSTRVILILPDRELETVSQGHALRPRFLTWPAKAPYEVIAVLHKMLALANES
jgi:hypothetical protein